MSRGTKRLGPVVVVILALVLSGCALSRKGQTGLAAMGLGAGMIEGAYALAESADSSEPFLSSEFLGAVALAGGGSVCVWSGLYLVLTEWELEPQARMGLGVGMIVGGAALVESAESSEMHDGSFFSQDSLGVLLTGGGVILTLHGLYSVLTGWEGDPQAREAPLERRRRQSERRGLRDRTRLFIAPNGCALTYSF